MKKGIKKLSVIILSACLIMTLLPISTLNVFAADNEQSAYMQFWTNLTDASYNINGKVEGYDTWLKTEYSDRYYTYLKTGDNTSLLTSMENGVEMLIPSIQMGVTQNLSIVNNGRYIKIQYTVRNASDTAQTFSLGSCADVMIGNDDYASITQFSDGSGFYMTGNDPAAQFNFIGKNAYGVTDVDTFWFGHYSERQNNLFNQVNETSLTGTDSGFAYSWKDRSIQASESLTFSVLIGVGAVNKAPVLDVSNPAVTFGKAVKGGNYAFSGSVSDEENTIGTEVYYAIDNGDPIKAYTFSGAPGSFNSSITLPSDITLGNHTISFYAQDMDGAISAVVSRTVEVVNTYTVTFISNGGTNVNPLTGVMSDSTISAPAVPTKSGYTFGGWYKDLQLTNQWNFETTKLTENTTLYAKWILNATTTSTVTIPKTGDEVSESFLIIIIAISLLSGIFIINRKYKLNTIK